MRSIRIRLTALLALPVLLVAGCGDTDNGTGPSTGPSLALAPASGTVVQGNSLQTAAIVTRGEYEGIFTFSVEGAPTGVTGTIGTQETGGGITTALIAIATTASAAPGSYPLVIRARGEGTPDVTRTYTLTVSPASSTNSVTVDFSGCGIAGIPIWLAMQDGAGAFNRILPLGAIYRFTLNEPTATVAWVVPTSGGYVTHLLTRARSVWLDGPQILCGITTPESLSGSLLGVPDGATARVSFGGVNTSRNGNGAFTLPDASDGTWDLFAYLRTADGTADRGLVRRAVNPGNGASFGTLSFQGVESFAPVSATMTMTGRNVSEAPTQTMYYRSGASCQQSLFYISPAPGTTFTARGVPPVMQLADDFHELFVAGDDGFGYRGASRFFHTFGPQTVALPTALPLMTITSAQGAYRRLQTSFVLPAEYSGAVVFVYAQGAISTTRGITMTVETPALAGQNLPLTVPDLSAVSGWDNTWAPSALGGGTWFLYAYNAPVPLCAEGTRYVYALRSGAY